MTLLLSEREVQDLVEMREVVPVVEECFRQQASLRVVNSPRTRSPASGSVLSVMHASLPYLGVAGMKCYLSSRRGARFLFVLFRLEDSEPLAVMGADVLGRYRTGAASAVATKFMAHSKKFTFCICGSGRQALTQVLAVAQVASLDTVRVWSPNAERREAFATELKELGFESESYTTVGEALTTSDVATAITSASEPFLGRDSLQTLNHLNLCGSNVPDRSEAAPDAVAGFRTIAVDDLQQSKAESGDLILSERAGLIAWDRVVELKDVISGKVWPAGPTLFKSNGVAMEDVALANLLYQKARKTGAGAEMSLGF